MRCFIFIVFVIVLFDAANCCTNRFDGKDVRAAGDWSLEPIWNAVEPNGLMTFNVADCSYYHVVGGLKPNTDYKWKVAIDNSWSENYGCNGRNGPDCRGRTDAQGVIRFKFRPENTQLSTDNVYENIDVVLPCKDPFAGKNVRAVGDWNTWTLVDPDNVMIFDEETCVYYLPVTGLEADKNYEWKVNIGDKWGEEYGCAGRVDKHCISKTNENGAVRYVFDVPNLSFDYDFESAGSTRDPSITKPPPTTTTTTAKPVNPIIPCPTVCSACTNNFASKLVRATGDWSIDAGSATIWNGAEPRGLLNFEEKICSYTLILLNLKPNKDYKWKITIDDSFKENYGCSGSNGPDCGFKTNQVGAVRLIVKPNTNPPQLLADYNVAECGDNICEEGETCSYCPEDCGECPPPVCGDGVCEEPETFMTCPEDCPNELPGCQRFNDEGCRSGSQIDANPGVEKRRWQTPKPGTKGYQPSFQHYYALTGYADVRYTSAARTEADLCIIAIHKDQGKVTFKYLFDGQEQSTNCKRYSTAHKDEVQLRVEASDGTTLDVQPFQLIWNVQSLAPRAGDYRNGQKGGIAEFFGWPHKDVEKECELLSKAGYLGAKLFPIHEQVISWQPFDDAMNPWFFMYQAVSYRFNGRGGTREELMSLIKTCRSMGVRVYVDVILNHMNGAGNDLSDHRNPDAGCSKWSNKTSSAPYERQSPFYNHQFTYKYNPNTGEPPSQEFPGAALGPEDFHCERILGSWSDLFILNNGWLVGLTDINTSKDNVRERQAAYLAELLSIGVSGFRIDAAKHISPEDLSAIFGKLQKKMGGQLPTDFFTWLEVITGGEANLLWTGPSWYGTMFENLLKKDLGSQSEVDKIKMWDGLYPKEPQNNPLTSRHRVVIQNDDHDQQTPGSSSRDMDSAGCVLVKGCPENTHRNYEIRLFQNPNGVRDNDNDWPVRFILSSFYFTHSNLGIPDGLSDCKLCKVTCESCRSSAPFYPAWEQGVCAYKGTGYTRTHRDIKVINAMRAWIKLGPITGADIGLPGCS